MRKISVDTMTFQGREAVLNRIEKKQSWLKKIKLILNYEIEIPLAGIAISLICWVGLMGLSFKLQAPAYEYPIVVIIGENEYEVY